MAWHRRYVRSARNESHTRTTVVFLRQELIWAPKGSPFKNPYTDHLVEIPLSHDNGIGLTGPNIHDSITTEFRNIGDLRVKFFKIRPPEDVFEDPEKIREKSKEDLDSEGKSEFLQPFKKALSTYAEPIKKLPKLPFIRCLKKSSVSINKLTFKLAISIHGSDRQASAHIGLIAAEAWRLDMERAIDLYKFVSKYKDGVPADEVPKELFPSNTISQIVETSILHEICLNAGIDPSDTLKRAMGRPKGSGKTKADQEENSQSGQIVKIVIESDGSISGEIIKDFADFDAGLTFEEMNLKQLAMLLVELEDAGYEFDAQMVEAVLDTIDPDWRDTILGTEQSSQNQNSNNPYTILGVSPESSMAEIKKAYKKLIAAVHPDRVANGAFFASLINNAYEQIKREHSND